MSVTRPTSVTVAGHDLEIVWITDPHAAVGNEGDPDQLGEINLSADQIRIAAHSISSEYNQREILLHEVIHGCLHATGVNSKSEETFASEEAGERVVSTIATILLDALRRNPGLVNYLLEDA